MKNFFCLCFLLLIYFNSQSQIVINEIFASNASVNMDGKYYNYIGWAELYNKGTNDLDIKDFYFSDEKSNKTKWKLPQFVLGSKKFVVIWFNGENNGFYANFKLDAKGDKLFLFTNTGAIADSVTYPKQFPNISYTRYPDGDTAWNYNSVPTIANPNSSQTADVSTSKPVFSQTGGVFESPLTLSLSSDKPGAEIFYTLNGSEPTQGSIKYSGPIAITNTTLVRAKAYETGFLPSDIITNSYIFTNHQLNLPVFSLTTDSVNLWDNMLGIYVNGSNGIIAYCSNGPRNYNQDWERPFNLEYYDTSGVQQLNQYIGVKIGGNCSRGFAQKTFALYPRNLYGKGKLKYAFFKDKNLKEFDRLFLRNAGNDWAVAYLRDALFHSLVKNKMDVDFSAYQPSVVFLNGNYWGMMDIREKIDEKYIMSNYNLEEDQFDMLENNKEIINGTADNYTAFMNFVSASDLSVSANYENVKSKMDMNEYLNYLILQIYIGNTDWPGNNLKYWRSKLGGSKWRWILYDLDFGFGVYDKNVNHNTLQFALATNGPNWPNPPWSTLLLRKLIVNEEFKSDFVRRFATYLNTFFEPNTVIHCIDSLQNNINYEMFFHNKKWNSIPNWNSNVDFLRYYAKQRPDIIRQHIVNTLGLSGTYLLNIKSNIANAGSLLVDGIPVNNSTYNGTYFTDYAVEIKPVAKPGYKFVGWYKEAAGNDSVLLVSKGDTWKYSDNGSLPATDWFKTNYNDEAWKSGKAQLGYGDGDEVTVVGYGNDPNIKYITTYFRKSFIINGLKDYYGVKLRILADDGAVIYLNGNEIVRHRMPVGTIAYATLANVSTNDVDEQRYFEYTIPATLLVEGNNVIAAEVHQFSTSSSDMSFDLELKSAKQLKYPAELVPGQDISFTAPFNTILTAKYQYLGKLPAIYINEIVADNQSGIKDENATTTAWIELYNSSGFDFNLAGHYISNDSKNLTLWKIPGSDSTKTAIDSLGFLKLWADGQTSEGILHLPFELNKNGGQLFLVNISGNDTTILDSLSYGKQLTDISVGRFKDGTAGLYYLNGQTPLAANSAPNKLPEFTSKPVITANVNSVYTYNIAAKDFENDKISFGNLKLPDWLSLTDNSNGTAVLSGTPGNQHKGQNAVSLTAGDGKSIYIAVQAFNIQVEGPLKIDYPSVAKWLIYPNPVKDFVQIHPENGVKNYQITLTNLAGKVVYEKSNLSGVYNFDMSAFDEGFYFLVIKIGTDTFISKLVKSE